MAPRGSCTALATTKPATRQCGDVWRKAALLFIPSTIPRSSPARAPSALNCSNKYRTSKQLWCLSAAADLVPRAPLALLIAMVLDQQIPLERAFSAPRDLKDRLGGRLDAGLI